MTWNPFMRGVRRRDVSSSATRPPERVFTDQAIGERHCSIIDHVIGEESDAPSRPRRLTRAEQRVATRLAIVEATIACLVEDGYVGLTTRRVAERAGVAQSTVMHHFETRDALLLEAVTHLALQLAERAVATVDLAALRAPEHREAVIDEAWREFTSPPALAAAQLWNAAWTEPELVPTLRRLEERLGSILITTAQALIPDQAGHPHLPPLVDAYVALIRGLVMAIPIWGRENVDARWRAIKPLIIESAAQLLSPGEG
jgi:AcrR family transcriptional regulator